MGGGSSLANLGIYEMMYGVNSAQLQNQMAQQGQQARNYQPSSYPSPHSVNLKLEPENQKPKELNVLQEVSRDLRKFIVDHKSTIYVIALCLIADHLFFQGRFRERLHSMLNKMLSRLEAKIDGAHAAELTGKGTGV